MNSAVMRETRILSKKKKENCTQNQSIKRYYREETANHRGNKPESTFCKKRKTIRVSEIYGSNYSVHGSVQENGTANREALRQDYAVL